MDLKGSCLGHGTDSSRVVKTHTHSCDASASSLLWRRGGAVLLVPLSYLRSLGNASRVPLKLLLFEAPFVLLFRGAPNPGSLAGVGIGPGTLRLLEG